MPLTTCGWGTKAQPRTLKNKSENSGTRPRPESRAAPRSNICSDGDGDDDAGIAALFPN